MSAANSVSSHSLLSNIWELYKVLQRGSKFFFFCFFLIQTITLNSIIGKLCVWKHVMVPPHFKHNPTFTGQSYFCMPSLSNPSALMVIKIPGHFGCWWLEFRPWEFNSLESDQAGIWFWWHLKTLCPYRLSVRDQTDRSQICPLCHMHCAWLKSAIKNHYLDVFTWRNHLSNNSNNIKFLLQKIIQNSFKLETSHFVYIELILVEQRLCSKVHLYPLNFP